MSWTYLGRGDGSYENIPSSHDNLADGRIGHVLSAPEQPANL
jgi:hypothetical protein